MLESPDPFLRSERFYCNTRISVLVCFLVLKLITNYLISSLTLAPILYKTNSLQDFEYMKNDGYVP